MLTAGFGRVAPFEALSITEIHNMMQINATSSIQILKYFYTGVMVFIAGIVSSPLFSVYAASKIEDIIRVHVRILVLIRRR